MPELPKKASPPDRSLNAVKHGCCATTPVLPGEDPALWREVEQGWLDDYQPQTATGTRLVTEAALAFWSHVRTRRQFEQVQLSLATKAPLDWTDVDHNHYSRFLRYHTAARRAFQNAFQSLEYLRKSRMNEQEARRRADERALQLERAFTLAQAKLNLAAQKQADAQHNKEQDRTLKRELAAQKIATAVETRDQKQSTTKKRKETFWTGEQWVEAHIIGGQTVTRYYPSNETLQKDIQRRIEDGFGPPALIYRRLYLPHGIPDEYRWTNPHEASTCQQAQSGEWCDRCTLNERGGYGLQRLLYTDWLHQIEAESQTPGRHLAPTGFGSFPQPKERGGDLPFAQLKLEWDQAEAADTEDHYSEDDLPMQLDPEDKNDPCHEPDNKNDPALLS